MRDLQEILEDVYGLDLTGWTLKTARVSDDGRVFTGLASNPIGFDEAYVAVVPEPATLALLALGVLGRAARRRRK